MAEQKDWIEHDLTEYTGKGERAVVIRFMNYTWKVRVPDGTEDLQAWAQDYVLAKLVRIVADNKEDIA